jgi:signal transduction histidine kinase
MYIRTKTLNIIASALIVLALANFIVLRAFVFPTFVALEHEAAGKDIQRAVAALNTELDDLSATLRDYSNWDDSYNFALGNLPSYPDVLAPDSVKNLRVDLIEIYDDQKNQLYAGVYDEGSSSPRHADWSFLTLDPDRVLFSNEATNNQQQGIVATPEGLFLFAALPILHTSGEGPPAGTYIFGRLLDPELVAKIKKRLDIDFDMLGRERIVDDVADQHAFGRLAATGKPFFIDENAAGERLVTYALMRDFRGEPVVLLKGRVPRDITAIGKRVMLGSVAGVALSGLVVMMIVGVLLQWLLVGPLVKLTRNLVVIGRSSDLRPPVALDRTDEIGTLSREFDGMLGRLAEAREQLLEQSYQSGVAEMASGVLHNLRNQLAPLSMRVGRLRDLVVSPATDRMDAALGELSEQVTTERGGKLASYVKLSVQDIARQQQALVEQLTGVSHDLFRVEELLAELDRFSHAHVQLEAVSLGEVVHETIALLPDFPDAKVRVNVDPELSRQPMVQSIRFVLKHVLHNLFVNAFEAIITTGRKEGTIQISAANHAVDGAMIDLQVRDDGIGIASEYTQEIFVRGFTTKKGRRRGVGLHWCANRIAAMGGKLFAESPGPGSGAILHVQLPVADAGTGPLAP